MITPAQLAAAARRRLADLTPRTVSTNGWATASRRDPPTRAVTVGRVAFLDADAAVLKMRPTWAGALRRRRWTSSDKATRRRVPGRVTVRTTAIAAVTYRPARWWQPGLLRIDTTPGAGDPWTRIPSDGTWRLRWWSRRRGRPAAILHARLAWIERENLLAEQRRTDNVNRRYRRRI